LLEIAVESVKAACAAERGGAGRIELCADLEVGGVTPREETMKEVRAALRIPIFALIRPRGGDFIYSGEELDEMGNKIEEARNSRMDGVVLGVLTADGQVDVEQTKKLVDQGQPMPVTFHRAFDATNDLAKALEEVIATGAARILTSGGAPNAPHGIEQLRRLIELAGDRIVVVPGGGLHADNVEAVEKATAAQEFHSGLGSVLKYGSSDLDRFEMEARKLSQKLSSLPHNQGEPAQSKTQRS